MLIPIPIRNLQLLQSSIFSISHCSTDREVIVVEEELKEKLSLDRKSSNEKSVDEENRENNLHLPGPEIDEVRVYMHIVCIQ